jgi:hypothetical protein
LITHFAFLVDFRIPSTSSGLSPGSILSNNAATLAASGDAIEVHHLMLYHPHGRVLFIFDPGESISAPGFDDHARDHASVEFPTEIAPG